MSRKTKADAAPAPSADQKRSRYQKGDVVRVHRSQVKNTPYNPRVIQGVNLRRLRNNVKKRGLLGPAMVWNRRSGNLVGGNKRLEVMDILEGTADYWLDVTAVDYDPKTEREQNIHLNSTDAQGEFDVDLLGKLLTDAEVKIDPEEASLSRVTLEMGFAGTPYEDKLGLILADANASGAVKDTVLDMKRVADMREELRGRKKYAQEQTAARMEAADTFVVLVFATRDDVKKFCQPAGTDPSEKYQDGRAVAVALGVKLPHVAEG